MVVSSPECLALRLALSTDDSSNSAAAPVILLRTASAEAFPQIARELLDPAGDRGRRRVIFRQPQTDAGDAATGHAMRHQRDRPKLHHVALLRPAPAFLDEVIGERHLGVLGRDHETIDLGERAERHVARYEEVAE